jgi:hypothetical protein
MVDGAVAGGPAIAVLASPAAPDQQPLCEAELLALEGDLSLAQLHAEISAFRQRERVFATVALDDLRLDERPIRIDPPTVSAAAHLHFALSPPQGRADYPSSAAASFTRV